MPESLSDGGTVVLVTGGAGYVGAHTCKALRRSGYTPVVFDNLSTGYRRFVRWGPLVQGDILIADAALAHAELGFAPSMSDLRSIIRTAWAWHRRTHSGRGVGDGHRDPTVL